MTESGLHDRVSEIAVANLQLVRPVFLASSDAEAPIAEGTCVLVEVDGRPLVLTAEHVLNQTAKQVLVGVDVVRPLTGVRFVETLPDRPAANEHLYDVGFVVPDEDFLSHWPRSSYMPVAHVDSKGYRFGDEPGPYLLLGYPVEDTTLNAERRHFDATPFSLTTSAASEPVVYPGQMNAMNQFLLRMQPGNLRASDGALEDGPELFGVSGGAIFSIGDNLRTGAPPRLIAIAIEWWRRDHAILGTDLTLWVNTYRREESQGGFPRPGV